jgi:transposase
MADAVVELNRQKHFTTGDSAMDQYSKTPLQLKQFEIIDEPTFEEVGGVTVATIHGKLIERRPERCPCCNYRDIVSKGPRKIRLKHLGMGGFRIDVEVQYSRWECRTCRACFRQKIPFRRRGTRMTMLMQRSVKGCLETGLSVSAVSKITGCNRNLVKWIDKRRLQEKAGNMKPTHPSRFLAVDEFLLHRGHEYATTVIDYNTGESVFSTQGNTYGQMIEFFHFVDDGFMNQVIAVSMDMNASYAKAFKDYYPHIKIVYDGFHIIRNYNDMVLTEVRRAEQRRLDGEIEKATSEGDMALARELRQEKRFLKGSRYLILSNRKTLELKDASAAEHNRTLFERFEKRGLKLPIGKHYLSTRNVNRLQEVLSSNEKLQTCYTLGEMLKSSLYCKDRQLFIDSFRRWLTMARSTGYDELRKFSNLISRHWEGILARTEYPLSNGPLEGTNLLIKNIRRQSYGIRDDDYFFLKIWEATRRHPKNRTVDESPVS